MKKKLFVLFAVIFALSLVLCACTDNGVNNGGETHQHAFTLQVAEQQFLKTPATCTSKAVYYKSCRCGEKGVDTFEYGEFAPHSYSDGSSLYCSACKTYFVETEDQLWSVAGASVDFAGQTIQLTADITLTEGWYPICAGSRDGNSAVGTAFAGTFDGNGHTIYNLTFNSSASGALGLIGICKGVVKDVTVANSQINKPTCKELGFVVGLLVDGGRILGCTVAEDCSIIGKDGTGAIAGRILVHGEINGCTNNGSVALADKALAGAGGIVGKAYYSADNEAMIIRNCTNNGTVTGNIAGGIVGLCAAYVSDCLNNGDVVSYGNGGGIVGQQTTCGSICNCTNNGLITLTEIDVSSTKYSAGGIVGYIGYSKSTTDYGKQQTVLVSGNVNAGNLNCTKADLGCGGIVGLAENHLTATQNVNACLAIIGSQHAGGILGSASVNEGSAINSDKIVVKDNKYYNLTTLTASVVGDVIGGGMSYCESADNTEFFAD